ncbi:MAG TPA: 2,3-bisphosphoglycerate-dependent phosphoglycerate mutase [Chryseolinea sp.]
MAILAIIRHGQSEYNLLNRFTGELDVPLTEEGRNEAKRAGFQLKSLNISFEAAFTSGLQRAQETLKIILSIIDVENTIPVFRSNALNERNYGQLQGLDKSETAATFSAPRVNVWRRGYSQRPPGGESLEDTYNRVIPYFQQYVEPLLAAGQNTLVVAHGNSLRALMMYLERISSTDIEHIDIATGVPLLYDSMLGNLKGVTALSYSRNLNVLSK